MKIKTEAWVIYPGEAAENSKPGPALLEKEDYFFFPPTGHEVLVEPIYGCWEANMTHALQRRPIDICRERKEEKVVLGNAGVVRILEVGDQVTTVREGDLCILFCNGQWDKFGYTVKVLGYDAPGSVGVLAKKVKLHEKQVITIPEDTCFSIQQWAAFSLRYITAWANWNVAYNCWRSQMKEVEPHDIHVWGWGGGVALAELALAKLFGCNTVMIASSDDRLKLISDTGISSVDRRQFADLNFNENRFLTDPLYKQAYKLAEETFIKIVRDLTNNAGVSIFIDNIGTPVLRATLKALARQGVITTSGWKHGMLTTSMRAIECIERHIHVHTHYARYTEGVEAVRFAHETGWMAPEINDVYEWHNIPQLAEDYAQGRDSSYFPIFSINPL